MVSSDFLLISWRDRLYSVDKPVKKKKKKNGFRFQMHSAHKQALIVCRLFTFGVVFVQLICSLLPFLYSVLEWRNQAFHKSTTES